MNNESEVLESHEEWAEDLDHALPESLESSTIAALPPGLGELKIRLAIQRLPGVHEHHFSARLEDSLLEVMRHGAKELGEPVLPPHSTEPLDRFFAHRRHRAAWGEPITDLTTPLWIALVQGCSRRFAIEYRLAVRINAKWDVAPAEQMTPRQLLSSFGFDPNDYSLYRENSADALPPDIPVLLKRGEHFEAQKDGRYGLRAAVSRGLQTIDDDIAAVAASGFAARLINQNSQRFVEISGLEIPSPPWSGSTAAIAVAVPMAYPQGGLDGFYLEKTVAQNGSIPYAQAPIVLGGRTFVLISWHYASGREWNPSRDDLASHIAHCRGYFLRRGVR